MARHDLLALTLDDLAALSNVGLARRAQKEIESGTPDYVLTEDATGNVRVAWADGIVCDLPTNSNLVQSICTCPATGICRHLLRAVLAYQKNAAIQPTTETLAENAPANPDWNPGDISDGMLSQHLSTATLNRARRSFEQGQVIEVQRGTKPTAYLHSLALTVRFLVAGDVRYTRCECAETQPCSHVALAVWAFRRLTEGVAAGIVDSRTDLYPIPDEVLNDIGMTVNELAVMGVANAPGALWESLRRLDGRCRSEGLIWPAEILTELVQHGERYTTRDARFAPDAVAALIGELAARIAAIRSQPPNVPQLYVRGAAQDAVTQVGSARLIGVGCGVRLKRKSIEIAAYMQNVETGQVVALRQEFVETDTAQSPRPFWQMAQAMVAKSGALSALGVGQLLIKGGKRTADAGLSLGRNQSALNPQTFYWEALRPPLLAESFGELRAHLDAQPPSALRPRRQTEDLFVCPVVAADGARFLPVQQTIVATLRDAEGHSATLLHPYTTRGQAGCEALLTALTEHADALRFVSGIVRATSNGLVIAPVALTFQNGDTRTTIQPWIAPPAPNPKTGLFVPTPHSVSTATDPISDYIEQLSDALGELWLIGLNRADAQMLRRWRNLHTLGGERGFVRFLAPVATLVGALQHKEDNLNWDEAAGVAALRDITFLTRLAQDVVSNPVEHPS